MHGLRDRFVKHRIRSGEPSGDKAMLKRSIGEIPTLSKHFHFQNCLWPSRLRSRKSIAFRGKFYPGNRARERGALCICRKRVCWKERTSGEQGSPRDADAFINPLARLYGHLQIYTCNNIPSPPPRTQKPQLRCRKAPFGPAGARRPVFPVLAQLARSLYPLSCLPTS